MNPRVIAYEFNREFVQAGDILLVRGTKLFPSRAIRYSLGIRVDYWRDLPWYYEVGEEVWGNHNAPILKVDDPEDPWRIGETEPPHSRLVKFEEYERDIAAGKCWVKVLRPMVGMNGAPIGEDDRRKAAVWWLQNVTNVDYNFWAYPRLIARCLLGEHFDWAANIRDVYCTQGCEKMYRIGTGKDWAGNEHSTPLTVQKRAVPMWGGTLRDVSAWALVPVHAAISPVLCRCNTATA